jgi:hypothetical protein
MPRTTRDTTEANSISGVMVPDSKFAREATEPTTFGNVKADVLADKDTKFQRMNFCSVIRCSQWKG